MSGNPPSTTYFVLGAFQLALAGYCAAQGEAIGWVIAALLVFNGVVCLLPKSAPEQPASTEGEA